MCSRNTERVSIGDGIDLEIRFSGFILTKIPFLPPLSLPFLVLSYHNWEHYSSVRNLAGPHQGLPRIQVVSLDLKRIHSDLSTLNLTCSSFHFRLYLYSSNYLQSQLLAGLLVLPVQSKEKLLERRKPKVFFRKRTNGLQTTIQNLLKTKLWFNNRVLERISKPSDK